VSAPFLDTGRVLRFWKPPKVGKYDGNVGQGGNGADGASKGDHVSDPKCFVLRATIAQPHLTPCYQTEFSTIEFKFGTEN
jgi:hypothetical protein